MKIGGADHDNSQSNVDPPPVDGNMSNEQLTGALDTYFSRLVASDMFSGNVLVAKDGKAVYEKSYGFADRANKVSNDSSTRFNLGSINKTRCLPAASITAPASTKPCRSPLAAKRSARAPTVSRTDTNRLRRTKEL